MASPKQLNLALAKWDGYECVADRHYFDRIAYVRLGERMASQDLPNYCADLNAVAKIEARLTEEQAERYAERLLFLIKPAADSASRPNLFRFAFATAAAETRCRALVAALNLELE